MMSTRKDSKGFLLGALAGGIIGSVTALLFAPKSGKELRQDISAGAQKVGDTTLYAANKVGETTGRIAREIGGRTTSIAGSIVDSVKGLRRDSEEDAVVTISGTATAETAELAEEALEAAIEAEETKQLS
ncbi:YtxH domain-containing protein [Paenibacillus soyae]|uniref:YtxH domain-containing protein n=1 Tax=Paenibacillus soyae TaxID=2969249 RepID=A0A9X2SAN2_9BACL|nr:YtxH domain-containing protein [Paenibacillus soyae]MCR2806496.1 YtxH domain-containing protein [Paenibacillus soyae]